VDIHKGLALVFGLYFLGELTSDLLKLPVPGSVLGMLYLTLALLSGLAIALNGVYTSFALPLLAPLLAP